MDEQPLTLNALVQFHREVVAPDFDRIISRLDRVDARFDDVFSHFDAIYKRFDRAGGAGGDPPGAHRAARK